MAKYRVTELSFIGHSIRQPGDIVDFDGEAGPNLEPFEEEEAPSKPARKSKPADNAADFA
jgi:hypothetical protein